MFCVYAQGPPTHKKTHTHIHVIEFPDILGSSRLTYGERSTYFMASERNSCHQIHTFTPLPLYFGKTADKIKQTVAPFLRNIQRKY